MNLRSALYVVMAFALLSTRCSSEDEGGTSGGGSNLKLNGTWTPTMRVSYYSGGGMVNEYTRFEIYSDSASYTLHQDQSTNKYNLKFTKDELDQIAKIFYDNDFMSLRATKHGVIYDKGSRSIMICDGSECENKGDDATSSYIGKDGEKLYKIQNEVLAMVGKKMAQLPKASIELVFEQSLIKTKYDYYVQFEPSPTQYDSKSAGKMNEATVELPEGSYNVNVYTYRVLPTGGTKYGGSGHFQLNTKENKKLTIGMAKDSAITITPAKK